MPTCLLPHFYRGWLVYQRKDELEIRNFEVEMGKQNSMGLIFLGPHIILMYFLYSCTYRFIQKSSIQSTSVQVKTHVLCCLGCSLLADGQNQRAAEFS